MKKFAILLSILFLSACVSQSEGEDVQERIADLESELNRKEEIISGLNAELLEMRSSRDELQSEVDRLSNVCGTFEGEGGEVWSVILAAQDLPVGTNIQLNGIIMAPISPDLVVETWVAGPESEDLLSQVVGCDVKFDIPRGMIITSNHLNCP